MNFDMNQMQDMLARATEMQSAMDERLAATVVEAESGGGAIVVRMNGKKELLKLTITPAAASAAASDLTLLEDLILTAVNAASRKADAARQSDTSNLLEGLNLPGL